MATVLLSVLSAFGLAQTPPRYSLVGLPVPGNSNGAAINSGGDVAGVTFDGGLGLPFLYRRATGTTVVGGKNDPQGWNPGVGWSLNDSGIVVGYGGSWDGRHTAFSWDGGPSLTPLPLEQRHGWAWDINNVGDVVGQASVPAGPNRPWPPLNNAFALRKVGDSLVYDDVHGILAAALGFSPQWGISCATGITASGAVGGWVYLRNNEFISGGDLAFRLETDGTVTLIPPMGTPPNNVPVMRPYAMNDNGDMAGTATVSSADDVSHAFVTWDDVPVDIHNDDLSPDSVAWDLNNKGDAVGDYRWLDDQWGLHQRAFVYTAGHMWDLASLTDVPPGWTLFDAHGINDDGLIAGTAVDDQGGSRTYLAIPQVSPAILIANLITVIEGFNLPKGMETSFLQKLNDALAALEGGDTAAACTLLQDAASHARAQSSKALTVAQAQQVIDSVIATREAIGCP